MSPVVIAVLALLVIVNGGAIVLGYFNGRGR